ncbi:hypothetical protein K501DRAFT_276234 [Backusella circina FSU 941]|nr:hypothetical protein K501DRAFT_276234 [Backusella circina FSU 941]
MNTFWPPPPTAKIGQKIETMFSNICKNEINEMLVDCGYNEDDVILKLITQTDYLDTIRQRIQYKKPKARPIGPKTEKDEKSTIHESLPVPLKRVQPKMPLLQPLLPATMTEIEEKKKRENEEGQNKDKKQVAVIGHTTPTVTAKIEIKPTVNNTEPHKSRSSSRLTLDDALKQINEQPNDAFEGWSSARLRAYKMIDKNPNSYYYRFNAPGEHQRKGKWSDQETDLFLQRLKELGANSQWGLFSMSIPGRVGYQCSNYYRFMIESGHLHDPNYVLDQNGKARYLFDKKTKDGNVEKTFRKHSKHTSNTIHETKKKPPVESDDDDDDDPTFSINGSKKKRKTTCKSKKKKKKVAKGGEEDVSDHVVPN